MGGLEPPTFRVSGEYSKPTELHQQMRSQRDSNPYLAPWQGGIVTIQPWDQLNKVKKKEATLMRWYVYHFFSLSGTQLRPNLIVSAEHKEFTFTSTFFFVV